MKEEGVLRLPHGPLHVGLPGVYIANSNGIGQTREKDQGTKIHRIVAKTRPNRGSN